MNVRLFSFIVVSIFFFIVALFPFFDTLVIRDSQSNRLLWETPVKPGLSFGIRWIHSIHRTPVEEFFRVDGTNLIEYRMSFRDYGIGMSSELAPGERLVNRDGRFYVENMHRVFPEIRLYIGQVRANHTLLFQGEVIPLATLDRPGSSVLIRVEKRSIIDRLEDRMS